MASLLTQPNPAKLQMLFTDTEGYGWNEQYWFTGAVADLNALTNLIRGFMILRLGCATTDTMAVWARLQSAWKRDPYIFDLSSFANNKGTYGGTINNVSNRALIRLISPGVGYNKIFWGGIPDALVSKNVFTPDAAWTAAFNAWITGVQTQGLFVVYASVDNPQPPTPVANLAMGTPKGIVATMAVPNTLTVGSKYRISGASVLGYNGIKNVLKGPAQMGPNKFLLGGARPQRDNVVTDVTTATLQSPVAGPIKNAIVENLAQRNPGRPFGVRRGRRPTLLSLRPSTLVAP